MKKTFILLCSVLLLFSCKTDDNLPGNPDTGNPDTGADQTGRLVCENGMAGDFPCDDYDLMSRITLSSMNAQRGNDSWGWTDSTTGKEYAIMGLDNGTAFVDISDAENPIYLGKLPTATSSSVWRDIKVHQDHAFIVSEARGHGMQVFDLTKLRGVTSAQTFSADTTFNEFGSAHNIVINEESGYAYPVGAENLAGGSRLFNGGPLFININDPKNPVTEGGYAMDAYSHDAQVVTYNGPDADYTGKEILIGSNENEVVIVDVTDKANPISIAQISYPNVGYTHQGWFTEDQRYFILGDETDEQGVGFNTRTIVFDFNDLDQPLRLYDYSGPTSAIDHNGYVKSNTFYLANYAAGVRMIDVTNISTRLTEIGSFDTFPSNDNANFNGVWNVYPFFASGNLVVSDVQGGLFIIRKTGE